MGEVLEVRSLDEPDEPSSRVGTDGGAEPGPPGKGGGRSARPWRLGIAVGIVAVLAIAALSLATSGGHRRVAADGATVSSTTSVVAPPASTPEQAARAALGAWARFATSGDLSMVATTFDLAGPQYAELAAQAAAMLRSPGSPPYAFGVTVVASAPGPAGGDALVDVDAVLSRTGEADQAFRWELVMRRQADGRWLLWTVRDRSSSPGPTPTGGSR